VTGDAGDDPPPGSRPSAAGAVLLLGGVALAVISAMLLASALADGGFVALFGVLLGVGVAATAVGVALNVRDRGRARAAREAEPERPVPPMGWGRWGRRAPRDVPVSLGQEALLGLGLTIAGPVLFLLLTGLAPAFPGKAVFFAFLITVLGIGFLIHAAIVRIRRR
jgi:hypothetical protein